MQNSTQPSESDSAPGYDVGGINLGAETPYIRSGGPTTPGADKINVSPTMSNVPPRPDNWRSKSFKDTKATRKAKLDALMHKNIPDRDCGICFENAVDPCKTSCCSTLYCREHLSDWLQESEDSTCPNCETKCILLG